MTQPQIIAALQADADLYASVDSALQALKEAINAKNAGAAAAYEALYNNVVAGIRADKGPSSAELPAFGIKLPKPRTPRTAAQKALSAARRQQTKAARGILGKKQRQAITLAGQPGLVMVSPTGQPLPGAVQAPIAPANTAPAQEPQTAAPAAEAPTPATSPTLPATK